MRKWVCLVEVGEEGWWTSEVLAWLLILLLFCFLVQCDGRSLYGFSSLKGGDLSEIGSPNKSPPSHKLFLAGVWIAVSQT